MVSEPPPLDSIEIPDRPVPSQPPRGLLPGGLLRRRNVLLLAGLCALALIVIIVLALLFSGGDDRQAGAPAEAPLIKAEDQPIKVTPEHPGGMDVPNQDLLVYGRMHGGPDGKAPVERLLPEPEQPLSPPSAPAHPGERPTAGEPEAPAKSSSLDQIPPSPYQSQAAPSVPEDEPGAEPDIKAIPPIKPAPPPKAAVSPVPRKQSGATGTSETPPPPAKEVARAQPAAPSAAKSAPASGAYVIQLFAGRSESDANTAWTRLKSKNADILGGLAPSVARADLGDRGVFYRLRAGPIASEAGARQTCKSLSQRGVPCIIIRSGA
ncbi:MAG: SPOR domain-containing protein [Rhodospirillales bacterium]|nr:SPOR domain-containing protein [Rhodospirillales bacterium]